MRNAILLLSLSASLSAAAQQPQSSPGRTPSFRLNAYASYVFEDKFDSYYSNTDYFSGKVNGGFQWGLGVEYMINPYQGIELTYLRLDTKAPTTYYDGGIIGSYKTRDFDMGVNYLFLGSTRYFKTGPVVEPYLGIQVGMAIIGVSNPTEGGSTTGTKFAWGLKGGTNLWVSDRVGIKLQGAFQSVTQAVGGGLYFSGSGVSTGLSSYSTIYQFSLGGGLVFKLGGV